MQVTPHNTLAGCRLKPTRPLFHWLYYYSSIKVLFVKGYYSVSSFVFHNIYKRTLLHSPLVLLKDRPSSEFLIFEQALISKSYPLPSERGIVLLTSLTSYLLDLLPSNFQFSTFYFPLKTLSSSPLAFMPLPPFSLQLFLFCKDFETN